LAVLALGVVALAGAPRLAGSGTAAIELNRNVPILPTIQVKSVAVHADATEYTGQCPKTISFWATMSVEGTGTVRYKWIRNDGALSPEHTITFHPHPKTEPPAPRTTWTLGGPGFDYKGWQALQIIGPNAMESAHTDFHVKWTGAAGKVAPSVPLKIR
jgi:hypothetical protein